MMLTNLRPMIHRALSLGLVLGLSLGASWLPPAARAADAPAATETNFSPQHKARLDAYFEALDKYKKLMGSVTISRQGQPVYQKSIGAADLASGQKLGAQTRFRIGSISKVFTSVMIFQLVEAGKLNLDSPLSDFFPEIHDAKRITISMLLNHRSGIGNFTAHEDYATYMTQPQSREAMLKRVRDSKPVFEPDSQAAYSNSNYILLSMIIEKLTGQNYAEALQQRIVMPLGLSRTGYGGPIRLANDEARSYSFVGQNWELSSETDMSIPIGAGAIVSTPEDLNHFLRALFQGKLISQASRNQMTELQDNYGRGIFAIPFGSMQGFGHNGGIDGFQSATVYFPAEDLSLTLLSNGVHTEFNDVLIGILSLYRGDPFEIPDFSITSISLSPEAMQPYVGRYGTQEIPLKIEVRIVDGVLRIQASGQGEVPMDAYPKHEFRQEQLDLRIVFDEPVAGKAPGFTLFQSGNRVRFTREP